MRFGHPLSHKFIDGQGRVLGGVIAGSKEHISQIIPFMGMRVLHYPLLMPGFCRKVWKHWRSGWIVIVKTLKLANLVLEQREEVLYAGIPF